MGLRSGRHDEDAVVSGQKRILIVDDDKALSLSLAEQLHMYEDSRPARPQPEEQRSKPSRPPFST